MPVPFSQVYSPSCSVVICTRDRPDALERCLAALAHLEYPRFDVLVVDNASSDRRTREVAKRWAADYVVESRVGLGWARNAGARCCYAADVIAYLDDDAVAGPNWLSALAAEFEDPRVMAVTGRVLPLTDGQESAREELCSVARVGIGGLERRAVDRQTPGWFELTNFGGLGIGANMALRRAAFDIWPGFDTRLGRGATLYAGEENFALFSLVDHGYRVVYTPEALVRHPFPPTQRDLRKHHLRILVGASAYVGFLLLEQPNYRRATLGFAFQKLVGVRRSWRAPADDSQPRIAPLWREVAAALKGMLVCAGWRLTCGSCSRPRQTEPTYENFRRNPDV